jgi:predicted dehydrogenase
MAKKVNFAIIGLGFGAEFIPIYQRHPNAVCYAICQRNENKLNEIGDAFGIGVRYTDYQSVLDDPNIDAVHINTPIAVHGIMSLQALKAGKHAACTVPMATTVEECLEIAEAQRTSGKNYMMMETAVYTREFLYAKELLDSGKLGKIQFLRGSHQQNMGLPGWPAYWYGFPPMHYATHAVSPLLALAGTTVDEVVCFGSGRIQEEYIPLYGSPFAVESALMKLRDSELACEVTRSLFHTIRQYRESFDVYGTQRSFEWEQLFEEGMVLFSGFEDAERVKVPDYGHLLPREIQSFTQAGVYDEEHEHTSFIQGSGHGGSHPHLANEFIRSIVEGRAPMPDAATSANWTMAGLCAHDSALKGGVAITVPRVD